jgi:DNA-binding transcriptional regulator YbjK
MVEQLWSTQEQHWPDGQAARSNERLVASFVGRLERAEETVWIVVDGFEHMRARSEIIELFAEFAEWAEGHERLRVVLVGWEERLRPTLEAQVLREEIELMQPTVLTEFFSQLLRDQRQPQSADAVLHLVGLVEEQVGNDFAANLGAIAHQTFRIARSIAEPVRGS